MIKTPKLIIKNNGFTLVEIAIVILIFGLIIGGIMGPLKIQLDNIDRNETEKLIEDTKEVMIGFAIRNGRLPCPDTTGDGQENKPGVNCANASGTVPWATLGVSSQDAWNKPLTYRVDTSFADSATGTGCPDDDVPGVSFELCSTGNITVRASSVGAIVASGIPAIIVSHGKNWVAAGDANEQENSDNDANFVDKNHINQGYDDFVGWVNINKLIAKMVSANKLP
jgi:prepilin-type N-terminal cleavage/methylation domain-containing protein